MIVLAAVLLTALATWTLLRWCSGDTRLQLVVYVISFTMTNALSNLLQFIPDGRMLIALINPSLDLSFIERFDELVLTSLLLMPFLAAPAISLLLDRVRLSPRGGAVDKPWLASPSFAAVALAFAMIGGWILAKLAMTGFLGAAAYAFRNAGDYEGILIMREAAFAQLGGTFFGFVYTGLPFLAWLCLWSYKQTRRIRWMLLAGLVSTMVAYAVLCSTQKAPLLVFLVFLAVALLRLQLIKTRYFVMFGPLILAVYLGLQSLYVEEFLALLEMLHALLRVGVSLPFYVNVYPDQLDFIGINRGLGLLGQGITLDDNLRVFEFMYPSVGLVQGAAAAAAHVRAYAQGGIPVALLMVAIVALLAVLFAKGSRMLGGCWGFAVSMHGLMLMYFLTQTSLRGVVAESYGIYWPLAGGFLVFVLDDLLRSLGRQRGRRPQAAAVPASSDSPTRT